MYVVLYIVYIVIVTGYGKIEIRNCPESCQEGCPVRQYLLGLAGNNLTKFQAIGQIATLHTTGAITMGANGTPYGQCPQGGEIIFVPQK